MMTSEWFTTESGGNGYSISLNQMLYHGFFSTMSLTTLDIEEYLRWETPLAAARYD